MPARRHAAAVALALAAVAAGPATRPAAPPTVRSPWGHTLPLAFDDEFAGVPDPADPGRLTVDPTKWSTTFWQGSSERTLTGNGEAQYYMDGGYGGKRDVPVAARPDPFAFGPGGLTISAFKVDRRLWDNYWMGERRPFCSGLLCSDHHFTLEHGYVVARVQWPADRGAWPAAWLLPDADPALGYDPKDHPWPPEVDFLEAFGHNPRRYDYNIIVPEGDGHTPMGISYNTPGVDLTKDAHEYGFEWDEHTSVFTFDGREVARCPTPPSLNRPFYLLVNLAVGGTWYGQEMSARHTPAKPWQVDEATMPWHMRCDYVRAYAEPTAVGRPKP